MNARITAPPRHETVAVGPAAIRTAAPADADACGRLMHAAAGGPRRRTGPAATVALARALIADDLTAALVAEADGRVVGAAFVFEGDPIRGIGPVAVDPAFRGAGVGRLLTAAAMERTRGALGARLVQDAADFAALSIHAGHGFDVREPLALLEGEAAGRMSAGAIVRPMTGDDVRAANELCRRVLGHGRGRAVRQALAAGSALVLERDGRITGYMTAPADWTANHAVAESERELRDLLLGASAHAGGVSVLAPSRRADLFRWCLDQGLRVTGSMVLMSAGHYAHPAGGYLPSGLY